MAGASYSGAYQVSATQAMVTLDVKIGFGQNAVSTVRVNANPIGNEHVRSFTVPLGSNSELIDNELLMTTTVHDISPETDMTSVTVTITGGVNDLVIPMKAAVNAPGGVATYMVSIYFYS